MSSEGEQSDISKTAAKRKYFLTDSDLETVPFKMKPNPLNKKYAPMKVYQTSTVETIAIEKHGSLDLINSKHKEKSEATNTRLENKEEETKNLWDSEELFESMKEFMSDIHLPDEKETVSSTVSKESGCKCAAINEDQPDEFLRQDVIIHYFDCMHNRAKGAGSYAVHRAHPEVAKLDQETSYNDRRKLGHFCWLLTESDQLVVILYVTHKFPKLAANRPVVPVMNYDALRLGVKRLSGLLGKKLQDTGRTSSSLSFGTYLPYKADQTKFMEIFNEAFSFPVTIFITERKT